MIFEYMRGIPEKLSARQRSDFSKKKILGHLVRSSEVGRDIFTNSSEQNNPTFGLESRKKNTGLFSQYIITPPQKKMTICELD